MRAIGALVIPLFLGGVAQAESTIGIYTSGDELTSMCRTYMLVQRNGGSGSPKQQAERFQCYGFVVGALDTISHEEARISRSVASPICPPPHINANTVTEVVANYADAHPEKRQTTGYILLRMAIAAAWPCPR